MGFKLVPKTSRNYGGPATPAFKSYNLGDTLVGEVIIPEDIVTTLGWRPGMHFDVLEGDGDDAGWFALTPKTGKAKAKLRKVGEGAYSFRERTLATGLKAVVKRSEVMAKAEDGQFIFKRPDVD